MSRQDIVRRRRIAATICVAWIAIIVIFLVRDGWFCVICGMLIFFGPFLALIIAKEAFEKDVMAKAVYDVLFHLNLGFVFGLAALFLVGVYATALLTWAVSGEAYLPFDTPMHGPESMHDLMTLMISAAFALGFSSAPMGIVKQEIKTENKAQRFVHAKLRIRKFRWSKWVAALSMNLVVYLFIGFVILNFANWEFSLHPLIIAAAGILLLFIAILTTLSWLWAYTGLWLPTFVLVVRLGR